MSWHGEFYFGDYWAAFRGCTEDNSVHAHAAIQICLSGGPPAILHGAEACEKKGKALVVKPGVQHRLLPISRIMLVFVEPHSPFGQWLLTAVNDDIANLPASVTEKIQLEGPIQNTLDNVFSLLGAPCSTLDERLVQALKYLKKNARERSFTQAAESVGLSAPRLRALAKEQLGVPLTKLLAWHQLNGAARELAEGATLADAAHAAGYADQAHFTRAMRNLVGVTPKAAQRPLV